MKGVCYSIVKVKVQLAFRSLQDRNLRATIYFCEEWGSGSSQNVFLLHHPSHQTLQSRHLRSSRLLEKENEPQEPFVVVLVECRVNVIQWFCAGRLDTLPAFYEQR